MAGPLVRLGGLINCGLERRARVSVQAQEQESKAPTSAGEVRATSSALTAGSAPAPSVRPEIAASGATAHNAPSGAAAAAREPSYGSLGGVREESPSLFVTRSPAGGAAPPGDPEHCCECGDEVDPEDPWAFKCPRVDSSSEWWPSGLLAPRPGVGARCRWTD